MIDIDKQKARLVARKGELEARLNRIEGELVAPMSPDSEERAVEREGDEVLEAMGEAGIAELRAIDAALDRLAHDRYGICARCGEDIAPARLEAVPHAALCQACHAEINA
jgi:RNA polymerase-binding transcription factor DksA